MRRAEKMNKDREEADKQKEKMESMDVKYVIAFSSTDLEKFNDFTKAWDYTVRRLGGEVDCIREDIVSEVEELGFASLLEIERSGQFSQSEAIILRRDVADAHDPEDYAFLNDTIRVPYFICVECKRHITPKVEEETDIKLCSKCKPKFDLDKLWKMHDSNKLDALDFNENKKIRERFKNKMNG